jgi:hypothetical protein
MRPRYAVLLTPSISSLAIPVLFCTDHCPLITTHYLLTPLDSALAKLSVSVANKRLTVSLNPLDATLTKNTGEGGVHYLSQRSTFQHSNVPAVFGLSPVFSHSYKLFCVHKKLNSFVFKRFHTLYEKHPGVGVLPTFQPSNLQTCQSSPIRPIAADAPWCNNGQRRENSSPTGETTPLLPVSNDSERTSGTDHRSWSPLQVVPGSSVLYLDRSRVARISIQAIDAEKHRVGKAGSVRLG